MKKLTFLMCAVLACFIKVNAQTPQYVTTEPQKRNVLIEELTGRNCQACPNGHKIANQVSANNPDRAWSVNIHAGGYAPTDYPNLRTTDGNAIHNAFPVTIGYPSAMVNRTDREPYTSSSWTSLAAAQLKLDAELNIGGQAVINPATRTATITVEVYYTADSKESTNYLTVMMLQDSILGSQSGATSNAAQVVNGTYCHMHILRDVVTENVFGDAITPTTAGTLITKQYVYNIPEVIGDPNGVDVDLKNIHFLAFVTEESEMPILNVNELPTVEGVDEPIYPFIKSVKQEDIITCTKEKKFTVSLSNIGTEEITSMKFEIAVDGGETMEQEWTGNIPVFGNLNLDMFVEIPFGEHNVSFKIVEANNTEYTFEKSVVAKCEEWIQLELDDTEEYAELKLELAQDRWGNQITWEVVGHNDEVIVSGGPYAVLTASGIKVNEETIRIPAGECSMFVIEDNVGNGITGSFGEGYYKIYDKNGNVLVESDGNYGSGEYHVIYVHGGKVAVDEVVKQSYNIFPNPVKDILTVSGEDMKQVVVYNAMGQMVKSVNCNENTVQINVEDLQNGMYFVNVVNNNGEMTTSKVVVND